MKDFKKYIDLLQSQILCKYLKDNFWHEDCPLFDGTVRQFLSPDKKNAVLIPLVKRFSDYYNVMENTLMTIAAFENEPLKSLFIKLLYPAADIMKWRIADSETNYGSIPFSLIRNNINSITNLLSCACSDILSPATIHKKLITKNVQEQISSYKFGQTEIGSFVINIICPLQINDYTPPLFDPVIDDLPLSRRINIRVISNINNIQTAIKDKSSFLNDQIEQKFISVNFLKALHQLYDLNKDSEFNIYADWNSLIVNPKDITNYVELAPKCIDKVAEVIENFESKENTEKDTSFCGKIIDINGEPEIDKRKDVFITVATITREGKAKKIRCSLNYSEFYSTIDEAFQKGLDVRIEGRINNNNRKPFISSGKIVII